MSQTITQELLIMVGKETATHQILEHIINCIVGLWPTMNVLIYQLVDYVARKIITATSCRIKFPGFTTENLQSQV